MGEAQRGADISGDWQPVAARDRLSSTLFLTVLFHAVVILGVGFGAGDRDDEAAPAMSLDVVIVAPGDPAPPPEQARLLAQRSLSGAGNTRAETPLRTAAPRSIPAGAPGPMSPGESRPLKPGAEPAARTARLASLTDDAPARPREAGEAVARSVPRRSAAPESVSQVEVIDDAERETRITDDEPRELVISADTRESRIAGYLDGWKRRVERVGTLNFPRQAAFDARARHPTLEVAIDAEGQVREVVVRRSSGERSVDEAAVAIVRLAGPFEPFPEFLRAEYDVLRFAYEWRFGGEAGVARMSTFGES